MTGEDGSAISIHMEQLFLETLRIAEEALSGSLKSSQALPGTKDDLVTRHLHRLGRNSKDRAPSWHATS